MTPLAEHLLRRIAATGPLTIADYMAECLMHPEHGYYTTRPPFGAEGDFTTAPEISQIFGEMLGLCLAQAWIDQGRPAPFLLAELGPGRGTLMADALRAARTAAGFVEAAQVHLVEASPRLRDIQRGTLSGHAVTWHDRLQDLPEGPLFLVANEFFDALPIRQFTRGQVGWQEHLVVAQDGVLAPALGPDTRLSLLDARLGDTDPGTIVETCPAAAPIAAEIGARIAQHGGAALIVDYGGWRARGDTLQALRAHKPVSPFETPGAADLTAHVDFEPLALAAQAAGARPSALTPQGVFLERLGVTQRAQQLAQSLDGAALQSHVAAHRRLTHPQEMGTLFKVLGLTPTGAAPLPGLDAT